MTGDLTLHGQTRPLTVTMEHVGEADAGPRFGHRSGFEGVFTVKRSEFGMKNLIGPLGDEVRIIVSVEGVRRRG